MAGFRDLLVHGYADIDDARVVTTLHEHLDDFDRFRQALAGAVDGRDRQPDWRPALRCIRGTGADTRPSHARAIVAASDVRADLRGGAWAGRSS